MGLKESIKRMLPLSFYYRVRDVYASFLDIRRFYVVRRDFLDNSFWTDIYFCLKMFFWPEKRILFHPQRTSFYHSSFKLCAILGYKITTNPFGRYDVVFWNDPSTFSPISEKNPDKWIREIGINGACTDVGKKNVGRIFEQVFGYPLDVDPVRYEGPMVVKSNINAAHDGKVVQGPLSADSVREGSVYQKVINNKTDDESLSLVYRAPVYADEIPVVFLKYRSQRDRFTGYYDSVEYKLTEDVFSAQEISRILKMTKEMNVDYGELDVLRDTDGKIYVIDVNDTPGGPPRKMSHRQKIESSVELVPSFKRLLDSFNLSNQNLSRKQRKS